MSEVITIPVPTPIDLTGLQLVINDPGDVFISKITGTQTEFARFSTELTVTVEKMQLVAGQVESFRDQVSSDKQTVTSSAGQVASNKQVVTDAAAQVSSDKQTVTTAAGQVASDKQVVTDAAAQVASDKQVVTGAAAQVSLDKQSAADSRDAAAQSAADAAGFAATFSLPEEPAISRGILVQKEDASGFEYLVYSWDQLPGRPDVVVIDADTAVVAGFNRYHIAADCTVTLPAVADSQPGDRVFLSRAEGVEPTVSAVGGEFIYIDGQFTDQLVWDVAAIELGFVFDGGWRCL